MKPSARFFEGQKPPQIHIESMDNLDWYAEMKRRSFEGYSYGGTTFTGDQWWFYNHYPMMVSKLDKKGNPTDEFSMNYPFYSQDDDYLFKQMEEARQAKLDIFLFTGRGYGKTYLVTSVGAKLFYLRQESHGIISASGDDHADATWKKFRDSISGVNKLHPTWRLDLLTDNGKEIQSGEDVFEDNKWDTLKYSLMEKIVYDKKEGKTKGRRLDYQHLEEIGDWGGAATLKECIAASIGSWYVGSIKKARVFYTGTGGTVLSAEAKEICYNPDAYNLYKVKTWNERGTGIVIPAFKKYGGFWEKTGISDEVGAKADLDAKRALKKSDPDPTAYNKFIQEYPYNIDEMFTQSGANRFDQKILTTQHEMLENDIANRKGSYCNLHWRYEAGKKVGVDIEYINSGNVWLLEEPEKNAEGNVYPYLYVGGYDGIDVGKEDTSSGLGSQGSICIKKRLLSTNKTNNIYVCHHVDRPTVIDDLFDTCYKIMFLFQASVNIEDTKRGIVGHLKREKALRFLMKRPRLTMSDPNAEKETKLTGTTAIPKNFEYGENFLAKYIREFGRSLYYRPAVVDLRDFRMINRTAHDITVSMMMCEIGDDELMDRQVMVEKVAVVEPEYGYYTDKRTGRKKFGPLPKKTSEFNFKDKVSQLDFVNMMNNSEQ